MQCSTFPVIRKARLFCTLLMLCFPLAGCLTRSAGPTLPYVQPANSVPNVDPVPLQISARMQELETEMQRLRDVIERLQASGASEREIRDLQERVSMIEKQVGIATAARGRVPDASARITEVPRQDQSPVQPSAEIRQPAPAAVGNQAPPVEIVEAPVSAEERAYKDAYAALRRQSPDEAVQLFDDFLRRYPRSPLAADAVYWMAEARFAQARYDEAVLLFDRVIKEFPGSKKELDALLKQGQAFEKMGDQRSAAIIFQRVVRENPHTAQARIAAGKLKSSTVQ